MVTTEAIAGIAIGLTLSVAAPIVAFLISRRRMTLSWRNIAIGAGTFFVFAMVLEQALHYFVLQMNPVTVAWIKSSPWNYVAYGLAAAALFEEVGRYLAMRLLVKPTGNPGTAVAYGIGHGGIEAWLVGALAQVQLLAMAFMLNNGTLEANVGPGAGPVAVAQIRHLLEGLAFFDPVYGGIERCVAVLMQIAFSLLVWKAVSERKIVYLGAAIALHAILDLPAAMYQAGLMPMTTVQVLMAGLGVVLLAFFLMRLPKRAGALAA